MRQLMLTAAVLFLGTLAGCGSCGNRSNCGGCGSGCGGNANGGRLVHPHGVCDCEQDDYCSSRSPWIRNYAAPVAEPIAPPAKLPDGKKDL